MLSAWYVASASVLIWALYCEQWMAEAGIYGENSSYRWVPGAKFRALRVIIDAGLADGSMSPEQAVALFNEHFGADGHDFYVKEVRRYVADPGQAMSYLVGKQALMALRDEVQGLMGEAFELGAFHDLLLKQGSIPVALVRQGVLDALKKQGFQ